jgi:hypothetical protein
MTNLVSNGFAGKLTKEFWTELNISLEFTEAFDKESIIKRVTKLIRSLGIRNLMLLLNLKEILFSKESTVEDLTKIIIDQSDINTLFLLIQFAKGRNNQIERRFNAHPKRKAFEENFENVLKKKSNEVLKPFSKLLILYFESKENLQEIFFQFLRTKISTNSTFKIKSTKITKTFDDSFANELAEAFTKADHKNVSFAGQYTLSTKEIVFLFFREYTPTTIRDFKGFLQVINRCGNLIIVHDKPQKEFQIKCKSDSITNTFKRFVESQLQCKLERLEDNEVVFSFCDFKESMKGNSGIIPTAKITGVSFLKSKIPGNVLVEIKENEFVDDSVKKCLTELSDEIVQFERLSDLGFISFRYKGKDIKILIESLMGGDLFFRFDNSNWEPDEQKDFESALRKEYRIPLNRRISSLNAGLDDAGYYAYILNAKTKNEIQSYHMKIYEQIIQEGYLKEEQRQVLICSNNFCRNIETDLNRQTCSKCDGDLHDSSQIILIRNNIAVERYMTSFFESINDGKLTRITKTRSKPISSSDIANNSDVIEQTEKVAYYSLDYPSNNSINSFSVIIVDSLSKERKNFLYKQGKPVLLIQFSIHPRGHFYVDCEGIGGINFSYLLAVNNDIQKKDDAISKCQKLLDDVQKTHTLVLEKAALASRENFTQAFFDSTKISKVTINTSKSVKAKEYEVDVYNILRIIFPYVIKLGTVGRAIPDGIVQIPKYDDLIRKTDHTLSDVGSWNFIYDVKYTDKEEGYDLDISERDKIVRYINNFRGSKSCVFTSEQGSIDAHVIISNRINKKMCPTVASYVFGASGVKKENRDVRLIFIEDSFLLELYDWVQENSDTFYQKRPHLFDLIIDIFERNNRSDNVFLDKNDATIILDSLQDRSIVEKKYHEQDIGKALDQMEREEKPVLSISNKNAD